MPTHGNTEDYTPDFRPHDWSARDIRFLEPFATNANGLVSVLRNLPPEIVAIGLKFKSITSSGVENVRTVVKAGLAAG